MPIHFYTEDISYRLKEKNAIRNWIRSVIDAEKHTLIEVSYIFCSDEYLLNINREYLLHDTYTDIITFDHSGKEKEIYGDIFISLERVKENARQLSVTLREEILRVMVHGILHLCGYKDKKQAEKQLMQKKEDEYLARYRNYTNY